MAVRTYSPQTTEALTVIGQMIVLKRKEAKLTAQALADKAGVSRSTIHRIERGDPKCEIGVAFELATLLGAEVAALEVIVDRLLGASDSFRKRFGLGRQKRRPV